MSNDQHFNKGGEGHSSAGEHGKTNAPGQQLPGSGAPAPGRSGEEGRGHSEENRRLREEERAAERSQDQSTGGADVLENGAAPDSGTGTVNEGSEP